MQQIEILDLRFIDNPDEVTKFEDAINLCVKRKNEIDNVNTNLNQKLKNYVDGEDPYYREIQVKSEELHSQALNCTKIFEQFKLPTHLDQELSSYQKEYKQMEQQIKQQEDKKRWGAAEKQKQKAKLLKLIEEIQLSILNKLDLPEPDNKSGIIFNWIAGCLIKAKKGPVQLAEELKLKVEKVQLQPESIINQPAPPQSGGIFACGGRKPLQNSRPLKRAALPEEEQRYYENILAWKAIKQYVFSQEFKFQEKVSTFTQEFEKLEAFQIMLIEEIVQEKKEIIKAIFDIDIKDQVRVIIEINEIVLFLLKDNQQDQQNKIKALEAEQIEQNMRQKEIEIQMMQKQKTYFAGKEKRLMSLKSTFATLLSTSSKIVEFVKEKMNTNDQLFAQIEVQRNSGLTKELKVNLEVEDVYRRKRYEWEENLKKQQALEEEQREEQKKKLESQEQKKEDQNQDLLNQDNKEAEINNSNVQQANDEDYDYQEDSNGSQDDEEEKQDWIKLADDADTKHIQMTLFPDKIKTDENKKLAKQKNQGESLKQLMAKRKKN
ncbi:unnamed protein product [Paramecium pentaurelia]|uniref:Uncharacterized protein n=1 Tax=Paramecium pentaurelia TaxID=43138 RepID=A0A8S1XCM4_9CILI|nr:unnamed protein product [Paramecium pentaurelia]